MDPRTRKLLFIPEHDPSAPNSPVSYPGISSNTSSTLNKRPHDNQHKINEEYGYTGNGASSCTYGGFNTYRLSQPLDYSMALTILVLLTALFFMGFFSLYIRRFVEGSSVNPSRFRRRLSAYAAARSAKKGVDPDTVDSLPVYSYDGVAKQGIAAELECAICLSEFEEEECVKVIPFCGHVFHVDCIDTWLASHVTCPLCRTAKLFPEKEVAVAAAEAEVSGLAPAPAEVRVAIECDAGRAQLVDGVGSTAAVRDTWNEKGRWVGPKGLGRSSSAQRFRERVELRRSLSF